MGVVIKDPTHYSLRMLKCCGLHPDDRSKPLTVYFCVNYCCFLTIFTLAITGVVTSLEDDDLFGAIENLQAVFLYIHLLGKYPPLFFKKPTLSHLLQERSKFWAVEDFDGQIREECDEILIKVSRFLRNFIIVTILVVANFLIQPIVTGDLPVRVYVPKGCFHVINLTYWYLLPAIFGAIYGPDITFSSICVPVIVQFKLLAHKFENLDVKNMGEEELKRDLKKMVDHQNFLIKYCEEINRYTNGIFFNQVVVSTAVICMQLFVVQQEEFLLPNKLKCLGYCSLEIVQTIIYCLNAEMLSDASEHVGTAAYNSQWYETGSVDFQKSIVLVMAKAQNGMVFSGFGLVLVNLKTFTQIFKTAMSFLSYLNTMVSFER